MSIAFDSASELARRVREKEISSRELTDLYIARIEKHDAALNAVVVRDFEGARAAASAADEELARGDRVGPLHGVPMTIKEAYDIEGQPTTWGIPLLAKNIASSDAESVRRYKAAGAHFLGKTNVPINLGDFQSYNDIYGTTNNPWDTSRTPGLLGRLGRGARRGAVCLGERFGHRRLDPEPGTLLRRVRPQAHLRRRAEPGASASRHGGATRPRRRRAPRT